MAESFISDLYKTVGNKILDEGNLLLGVPEEARKMGKTLNRIKAVLASAEKKEVMEEGVKLWLRDLKDLAYDIEDVLDDWSIAQMKDESEGKSQQEGHNSKGKVCFPCIPTPFFGLKQAKSRHHIARDLESINKRLDMIDERKTKFNFPISNISVVEGSNREETTSYEKFTSLPSQEEAKVKLRETLVHGDSKPIVADGNHIPIISIVGMGGIGKTTLARLVYNDEVVNSHFPQPIWVCVSNTFNEMNVARAIAEGLNLDVRNDSTKQKVLSKIDGSIRGRKFLLILDDVWEESEGKWNAILQCLAKGDTQRSRILMTTRNLNFARRMGEVNVSVGVLSEKESWTLFSYYAFTPDSNHLGLVEDIALKLAEKCNGLPLAIQVLGRHMVTRTTRSEWNDVHTSEMWDTKFEEEVFNSLAFSYLELRSEAKRCFAFCSIFPKDDVMLKSELIHLWMAQGYLQGGKIDQMEVLGEECFQSLVSHSFFRVIKSHNIERADIAVIMHDLIHDFALYISNGEAAALGPSLEMDEGGVISATLRHVALSGEISQSKFPYSTFDLKALRTVFLSRESVAVLDELCLHKSYIRVLDIGISSKLETLDDYDFKDIGKLIHLRYLRLVTRDLSVLPKEICELNYLQTLDLRNCYGLEKLPNEIGKLINLRHLLFSIREHSPPKGLRKLSSLRTLSYFFCSSPDNEDCSSLEDLRDLNNLRGDLWLKNLNSVTDFNEATGAELHMKTQIRRLMLEFGDGDASFQAEVLEALKPAEENMEFLEISGHRGKACPRWIGQMRHLTEVRLVHVNMEFLPELGTLCFLRILYVKGANTVKHVGAEFFGKGKQDEAFFPKLEHLTFIELSLWEHWEGPEEITRNRVTVMPSLRHLRAINCKALWTLPRFLEDIDLQSLIVESRHLPRVELAEDDDLKRWRIGNILLPQTLKTIDTLTMSLMVENAPNRPKASDVVQQPHLNFADLVVNNEPCIGSSPATISTRVTALTRLRVISLSYIEDDSFPPLGSLSCLERLSISEARRVEQVGDEFLGMCSNSSPRGGGGPASFIAFPSLNYLCFTAMSAWLEWKDPVYGDNLAIMPSLRTLKMYYCPKLKSLPHFFEAVPLERLEVGPTEEGDMLKIRTPSTAGENEPATYEMIKARSTTDPPQLDVREIKLIGVRNGWLLGWEKYCVQLRLLDLHDCTETSFAGLEASLPSLEKLRLAYCKFRWMGTGMLRISSLQELRLEKMHDLNEWEDTSPHQLETISSDGPRELSHHGSNTNSSGIMNSISNLRTLSISLCPELKALPSFLRNAPLEELEIRYCDALERWWENEAGEDWHNWKSTIRRVDISQD